jgi:hypothetical protein
VPLAVRSPYTSAWSTTAGNSTLNSGSVSLWTGDSLGWDGIITVDGISYEYLSAEAQALPKLPNLQSAVPISVSYDSSWSNFTFHAGSVKVYARFFSPVIPTDYCRTSIPLSYLETSWESSDGNAHDVQLYGDTSGNWIAPESDKTIKWKLFQGALQSNNSVISDNNAVYTW